MIAALAQNSRPEVVIPLDRLNSMMGGGSTVVVQIEGDIYGMDDFETRVNEALLNAQRRGVQTNLVFQT